jgi:cobalt/nickel transport protein
MSKIIIGGLLVSFFLAVFLSPLASSSPDGLEKVAEELNFLPRGEGKEIIKSPFPHYTIPGLKNEILGTALAGLIGTLLTFASIFLPGWLKQRRR